VVAPGLPQRYTREADTFQECRERLESSTKRFDEMFRGIEFALVTNAEQVSWEVSNTDLRIMRTDSDWGFEGVEDLWIYFRICENGECCELLWIEIADVEVEDGDGNES
jgi:hypothetical protein